MIEAGKLKDSVTIIKPPNTPDSSGQRNPTFVTHRIVPADVVQLSGKESVQARQLYGAVATRVRIRWRDAEGVTSIMRVIVDGRVLNINSVVDVGRKRQMVEMICTELV